MENRSINLNKNVNSGAIINGFVKKGRRRINPQNKRKFRTTVAASDIEWEKIKQAAERANCSINNFIIKKAIDGIVIASPVKDSNQTSLF